MNCITLYDLIELGKHIAKVSKKETTFIASELKIYNVDFNYISLFFNTICIKHKNDNKNRQYKTIRGAIAYVDKFYKEVSK